MLSTSVTYLAALSFLTQGILAQQKQGNVITSDTHFYGQSPAVIPTRKSSL
jgi:hypothetical protein